MYHIFYGFLWLVSLLPLPVLYLLSDLIYGFVFYIVKYRRDVVMNNLAIAFPGMPYSDRLKIARRFYHNMIDTFIEAVKMISAPVAFLEKRVKMNVEDINKYFASGRSVQVHIGHNFNWEWANSVFAKRTSFKFLGVYMPIDNRMMNRLFYDLRSRTGTILISARNMREEFVPYRNSQYVLGLAADQNPGHPGNAWWFEFFNRATPFVKGPAKGAVTNNTLVFFAYIHKPKRGHYEVKFELAHENPGGLSEVELTGMFVHYLEKVIRQYPEMWLWSHRRWKHDWKEEYGPVYEASFSS